MQRYDRQCTWALGLVHVDSSAGQFLRVVNVVISLLLLLNQVRHVLYQFFRVDTRIYAKILPTTHAICHHQDILGYKHCIFPSLVDFLWMGTDGAAVNEFINFVLGVLLIEGNALFGFGFEGIILHKLVSFVFKWESLKLLVFCL